MIRLNLLSWLRRIRRFVRRRSMASSSLIIDIDLDLRNYWLLFLIFRFFSLDVFKGESWLLTQIMVFLDVRVSLVIPCRITLKLVQENVFCLGRLAQMSASLHSTCFMNLISHVIFIIFLLCAWSKIFFAWLKVLRLQFVIFVLFFWFRRLIIIWYSDL